MAPRLRRGVLGLALALTEIGPPAAIEPPAPAQAVTYEVYAVRFATLPAFAVRSLIADADRARTLDIAMMYWLLRGTNGRTVILDAGFYRDKFMQRWRPVDYVKPPEALSELRLTADDVTDVVISHVHWDHVDGADLFPKARVWIQREEMQQYVREDGRAVGGTIDSLDAAMLGAIRTAGRLTLVEGDAQEILPGITAYTGGRHTFASQYLGVRTARGVVVLASDNAYLYENLTRHVAIAQTLDAQANLAAQTRMATIASEPRLIVPGHDPAVFERFTRVGVRVVKIE